MPPELTMESLGKDILEMKASLKNFVANSETDKEKEAATKKAMDEKVEEEKKEAKKAAYNAAIKIAMDEKDHDKKMEAMKKAEDDYNDKKHEAFGKPDEKTKEAMDEKKEHEAQIASIINDKKSSMIAQILSANKMMNPNNVDSIALRLKTASIKDIQKEFNIVKPFVAGVEMTPVIPQEKIIPFFANITPADIDGSQLNAASPDSQFMDLTEEEFQKMENGV